MLQTIAADADQPAIARATALQALRSYPDSATLALIQQGLGSEDPLQRLGALDGLESLGAAQRVFAISLLWDDLKAVRIAAARLLAALPTDQLPEAVQRQLATGIREYIAVQEFNAERPEAQLNLGTLYADQGRDPEAERAYRKAIRLQPRFVPAYVNMAHLLSRIQREPEAEGFLRSGLELNPQSADLQYARQLQRLVPDNPSVDQLVRDLEAPGH